MNDIRVEIFERDGCRGRRWYFRGVDEGNNEILFPSQPYRSEAARDRTATRIAAALGTEPVEGKRW